MERRRTSGRTSGWERELPEWCESHSAGEMSVLDVSPLRGSVAAEFRQ